MKSTIRVAWFSLVLALALIGCAPSPEAPPVLDRPIPYPIVLIPGLSGDAGVWRQAGFVTYLKQQGLHDGGTLAGGAFKASRRSTARTAHPGDFFTVQMVHSQEHLASWVEEIRKAVVAVTLRTGARRVVLVGYSTGGLAARSYVVQWSRDHRVAHLLTISAPHQGSELALVAYLAKQWQQRPVALPTPSGLLVDKLVATIEEQTGYDLSWRRLLHRADGSFPGAPG